MSEIIRPIPKFGTGVATALATPTGSNGAVQLVGEPLTPTSIILPDMTGLTPPVGALGLKGGALAVGDGATVGGKIVAPMRYFSTTTPFFIGQPKSSAFAKLFGIPIPAERMVNGTAIRLTGRIWIYSSPAATATDITGITSYCVGRCFSAGSTVQDGASGATGWNKTNFSDISDLSTTPLLIELSGGQPTVLSSSNMNAWAARKTVSNVTSTRLDMNGTATTASFTPNVANELCLMFQAKSGNSGNYGPSFGAAFTVEYDLTLEYTN